MGAAANKGPSAADVTRMLVEANANVHAKSNVRGEWDRVCLQRGLG